MTTYFQKHGVTQKLPENIFYRNHNTCLEILHNYFRDKVDKLQYIFANFTAQSSRITIGLLTSKLGVKRIERGDSNRWPLRSPDLSILALYLWETLKQLVYSKSIILNDLVELLRSFCVKFVHSIFLPDDTYWKSVRNVDPISKAVAM